MDLVAQVSLVSSREAISIWFAPDLLVVRIDWCSMYEHLYWTLVPDRDTLLQISRNIMRLKSEAKSATPLQVLYEWSRE